MKISELQAKLEKLKQEHGDLDVFLKDYEHGGIDECDWSISDTIYVESKKQALIY